jgi:acylphosphatase
LSRAVHVRVTGIVQGVGYRAWTEHAARARGLDGWVRNRRDGSVEAVIAGDDAAVEDMLRAFRIGPPSGEVEDVITEAAEMPEAGFRVLSTA